MLETNNLQDVYCTQPKKVNDLWVMNVHTYGETLGVAQALLIMGTKKPTKKLYGS